MFLRDIFSRFFYVIRQDYLRIKMSFGLEEGAKVGEELVFGLLHVSVLLEAFGKGALLLLDYLMT